MRILRHSVNVLFALFCLSACGQLPEKASPFTAVKWDGDQPIVQFEGDWYEWIKIEEVFVTELVDFAKKQYGDRWQKRVSEDLVEVLSKMGEKVDTSVKLMLKKEGKISIKTSRMTEENRRQVWAYNQDPTAHSPIGPGGRDEEKDIQKVVEDQVLEITKPDHDAMMYPFESARIVYEYTDAWKGTMTMYIDDYGKTVVLVKEMSELGMADKKTIIWQHEESTIIDHDKKTYWSGRIRIKDTEPPTIGSYGSEERILKSGFDKLEDLTIAGKPCKGYKNKYVDASYWLWKGIDLKQINHSIGKRLGYTKVAISVEEGITIPAELFEIPAGYTEQ